MATPKYNTNTATVKQLIAHSIKACHSSITSGGNLSADIRKLIEKKADKDLMFVTENMANSLIEKRERIAAHNKGLKQGDSKRLAPMSLKERNEFGMYKKAIERAMKKIRDVSISIDTKGKWNVNKEVEADTGNSDESGAGNESSIRTGEGDFDSIMAVLKGIEKAGDMALLTSIRTAVVEFVNTATDSAKVAKVASAK